MQVFGIEMVLESLALYVDNATLPVDGIFSYNAIPQNVNKTL